MADIGCRLFHSAAQTIATGSWTSLAFDTERYDTDGMHDTAANNTRITIQTAGKYVVGGNVRFSTSSDTTIRGLRVYLNGATIIGRYTKDASTNGGAGTETDLVVSTIRDFTQGDYVELQAFQLSGSNKSVNTETEATPIFYAQRFVRLI